MNGISPQVDTQDPRFQVAFTRAVNCAKEHSPSMAAHQRIDKAIALVLTGHVTLNDQGALVQSEKHPQIVYQVSGSSCTCPSRMAPGEYGCKHAYSAWLLRKALRFLPTVGSPLIWVAQAFLEGQALPGVAEEWPQTEGFVRFYPADDSAPRWLPLATVVLADLTEEGQFFAGMRQATVADCDAF